MKLEQAARQALEALEVYEIKLNSRLCNEAITALREALAEQAEQGPFLEVFCDPSYFDMWCVRDVHDKDFNHTIHVNSKETANHAKLLIENWVKKYAAPVRTKDLTDDEIDAFIDRAWDKQMSMPEIIRAVIAADRELNK